MVALHATNPKCRESIQQRGLLAAMPYTLSNTGRYNRKARKRLQPWGLYVFSSDGSFDHPTRGTAPWRCIWGAGPGMDVWQVSYIGPVTPDPFVENALCFSESVPPEHCTLITYITGENR